MDEVKITYVSNPTNFSYPINHSINGLWITNMLSMPVKYLVDIIDDASADTLSFIINEHSLNFKDLKVSLRDWYY